MGIALIVAFLFRLNRVAILFGTYLNNPWTLAPIYLAGTSLGCLLLGVSNDGLDAIDWELTGAAFRETLWADAAHVHVAVLDREHAARHRVWAVGYFVLRRFWKGARRRGRRSLSRRRSVR